MKYRNRVLGLVSLLIVITYLDRVCISVAGPRIQDSLHLGPAAWGWVSGIFTFAYAAFEIPSGILGDRIGPRRVLTRIVLWWSAFTSITGLATGYYSLLVTRLLFGVGEAGAFPNTSIVVGRWFPVPERGRAFGIILRGRSNRRSHLSTAGRPHPDPLRLARFLLPVSAFSAWHGARSGIRGSATHRRKNAEYRIGAGRVARTGSSTHTVCLPWARALRFRKFLGRDDHRLLASSTPTTSSRRGSTLISLRRAGTARKICSSPRCPSSWVPAPTLPADWRVTSWFAASDSSGAGAGSAR